MSCRQDVERGVMQQPWTACLRQEVGSIHYLLPRVPEAARAEAIRSCGRGLTPGVTRGQSEEAHIHTHCGPPASQRRAILKVTQSVAAVVVDTKCFLF